MDLSHEDSLRLNVLLSQELHAVRIDEGSLTVHALSTRGEARVPLNPTCRAEQYLRRVRELLSSQVLGSPGGYPVYLRRWTRMGQARDESLARLLLLGEPEAVVAVVYAGGLTDELARRAWWAMPTADNARCMLARSCVAQGNMGPVLAQYLLDYLPFEEESRAIMESVRLMLQPGLITEAARLALWRKAQRKNTYYVGFLAAQPDTLPETPAAHPAWATAAMSLTTLLRDEAADADLAQLLVRALSPAGQAFLEVAAQVLTKPNDQDVVVTLMDTIGQYFVSARPYMPSEPTGFESSLSAAEAACETAEGTSGLAVLLATVPELRGELAAILALSTVGEHLVAPIFARSDAIGTVMRRKLEPISAPILRQFARLRGGA